MRFRIGAFALVAIPHFVSCQQGPTLDSLSRDVWRVESVREVKDVTRTFCQLAQFGRWSEMASLFAESGGTFRAGDLKSDNVTAKGRKDIETWLRQDAGGMDGIQPGSLSTWLANQPVVTLAQDSLTAKARWLTLRLLGDGKGATRIQGGVFENDYIYTREKDGGKWEIATLHYFPQFDGDYAKGWGNTGTGLRSLLIVPYHYTPDLAGTPILGGEAPRANVTIEDIARRITRLNNEDEVRNLQHTYGFYVDRRMWSDVVDLFASDPTVTINGVRQNTSIRSVMERMGPEKLSAGILNDHALFDTIVNVSPDGNEAVSRGIQLGMIGDSNTRAASWEFSVFRNRFTKDPSTGLWKFTELNITPLVTANYSSGWGWGGGSPNSTSPGATKPPPAFLPINQRSSAIRGSPHLNNNNLTSLHRALSRSAAFDNVENISGAYGYFADDIRCQAFADLHHSLGHKESPFAGWYRTVPRIAAACLSRYNTYDPNPQRPRVPYHWRPQPVILVSADARSASCRARLIQWGTSNETLAGFPGVFGFNGAIYHDQMALEPKNGTLLWKLWSLTIDEFYWQSPTWSGGWASANPRNRSQADPDPSPLLKDYPPDLVLSDPALGEREVGLQGGKPPFVTWPEIRRMWFAFRNPVSGRLPEWYSPGCVPCQARPDWGLLANGYQEPPTGPTTVAAGSNGTALTVKVRGGPGEPVGGEVVLLEAGSGTALATAPVSVEGDASFLTPPGLGEGSTRFIVSFPGTDRLSPGQTLVVIPPTVEVDGA